MTFVLPDPYVGGPIADGDGIQRNFEKVAALLGVLNDQIKFGEGDPENVVTAPVGTLYLRTDGGAGTTLYVKEANTDDTGWQAK